MTMKLTPEELQELLQTKSLVDQAQLLAHSKALEFQNLYLRLLLKYGASIKHIIDSSTGEIIVNEDKTNANC